MHADVQASHDNKKEKLSIIYVCKVKKKNSCVGKNRNSNKE